MMAPSRYHYLDGPEEAIASRSGSDAREDLVMAERSFIDYRLHDRGVMVLSLVNPPLNLTTLVTLDKLLLACRHIAADERVRAVVVTGSLGRKWLRTN